MGRPFKPPRPASEILTDLFQKKLATTEREVDELFALLELVDDHDADGSEERNTVFDGLASRARGRALRRT